MFAISANGQRRTPPLPEWRAKAALEDLDQGRPGWALELVSKAESDVRRG